jgi:hypothetical protein
MDTAQQVEQQLVQHVVAATFPTHPTNPTRPTHQLTLRQRTTQEAVVVAAAGLVEAANRDGHQPGHPFFTQLLRFVRSHHFVKI